MIMSNGPLNRPKLRGIPGIDSYKEHTFHTRFGVADQLNALL
jgi:hypothetical protein